MWIRLDTAVPNHNKVTRLADRLGWSKREALGAYVSLLCWASANADPDGMLPDMSFDDLGKALGFSVKLAHKFCLTCSEVGILDCSSKGIVLHGWSERNGAKKARRDRRFEVSEQDALSEITGTGSSENEHTYKHTNEPTVKKINNYTPLTPQPEQIKRVKLFLREFRFSEMVVTLSEEQYNTLAVSLPENEDLIFKLADLVKEKKPEFPYLYAMEILTDWQERGIKTLRSYGLNKRE